MRNTGITGGNVPYLWREQYLHNGEDISMEDKVVIKKDPFPQVVVKDRPPPKAVDTHSDVTQTTKRMSIPHAKARTTSLRTRIITTLLIRPLRESLFSEGVMMAMPGVLPLFLLPPNRHIHPPATSDDEI
ncbi:hypothetical protein PVAP13_5NG240762 [Panicum virgatum]|uniref:Uncharacterized protein n=1 Tax=Panicum virgatum TaxID=38727 RepID=A0A8T0RTI7_PANVG|nr:hypothetical protein PVAP13_5NG240762 [Panicum virgatum]